jgi:hypothetical protein
MPAPTPPKRGGAKPASQPNYDNCDVDDEAPPLKPSTAQAPLDNVRGKARRYVDLRDKEKQTKKEKDELSTYLKSQAIAQGIKNGKSHVLDLGDIIVQNVAVPKNKVDQTKAAALLKSKGLLERCTVRVLSEEELTKCFQEGLIDMDEINSFTTEEVSFRIDVTTK